ncbi:hypothetical protein [Spirosoma radiotolerans]|nr:hypothetical protein [Spirosoma radiotolerans]
MQTDNQIQELTQKEQQELTGGNWLQEAAKAVADAILDMISYKGPQA